MDLKVGTIVRVKKDPIDSTRTVGVTSDMRIHCGNVMVVCEVFTLREEEECTGYRLKDEFGNKDPYTWTESMFEVIFEVIQAKEEFISIWI